MMEANVYGSLIASIVIQVMTGIIGIITTFIKLPSQFLLLKQLMLLETFVQIIEGLFYTFWLLNFKKITNITPLRYIDWAITTPTMLINLVFYLIYLTYSDGGGAEDLSFVDLFHKEYSTILIIVLLNWMMLLFGYLGETSVIPVLVGVFAGFIPFLLYYYIIYNKYATLSDTGFKMYVYFFIFWSLYGIVALLPYSVKTVGYNILDVFSKNFFGLFLSYLIITAAV